MDCLMTVEIPDDKLTDEVSTKAGKFPRLQIWHCVRSSLTLHAVTWICLSCVK